MTRATAFDAARDGLFAGAREQLTGGPITDLVTAGAVDQLTDSGVGDLVWAGAGEQLGTVGGSIFARPNQ